MKIIPIVFLILFAISVIGIAFFPSLAMVVCGVKTDMCHLTLHQIEGAVNFFVGIFSVLIYFLVILLLVESVALFEDKTISLYLKNKIISLNNIFFDYLKILFSRGILKPKLY
jgi:hypothetical protein